MLLQALNIKSNQHSEGTLLFWWDHSSRGGMRMSQSLQYHPREHEKQSYCTADKILRCSWSCWKLSLCLAKYTDTWLLIELDVFSNSLQIKHEGLDDVSHFGDWKESKKRPWTLAMLRFCWNNIRFTLTYSMGLNIDFQIIWNAVFINNYWQGKALFLEALVCTVRLYFFLFWSAARLLKNAVQETSAVN